MKQPDRVFNLQGEACPYPAMYVSAALKQARDGEVVEILVDHLCAVDGVPAVVAQLGHRVVSNDKLASGVYRIRVEVRPASAKGGA
ncbi:MAG: sulfurtransferase TusA family protein [Chloroflexi bacterium]|nr:sulfurtransferase TusA family protein [Chloroflexota bacterium]